MIVPLHPVGTLGYPWRCYGTRLLRVGPPGASPEWVRCLACEDCHVETPDDDVRDLPVWRA